MTKRFITVARVRHNMKTTNRYMCNISGANCFSYALDILGDAI